MIEKHKPALFIYLFYLFPVHFLQSQVLETSSSLFKKWIALKMKPDAMSYGWINLGPKDLPVNKHFVLYLLKRFFKYFCCFQYLNLHICLFFCFVFFWDKIGSLFRKQIFTSRGTLVHIISPVLFFNNRILCQLCILIYTVIKILFL